MVERLSILLIRKEKEKTDNALAVRLEGIFWVENNMGSLALSLSLSLYIYNVYSLNHKRTITVTYAKLKVNLL